MEELLQQILQECRPYTGQGALASYIPELARQDPDRLGIAVFHKDGTLVEAGDSRRSFTIQSVMKPLSLLLALQDNGRETVRAHVGVEATGKPFDAINVADNALLAKHLNPMVNAGAILMCQLVGGETYDQRFARLLGFIRRLAANEKIDLDEEVYHSEKATGSKNRALAYLLKAHGLLHGHRREPGLLEGQTGPLLIGAVALAGTADPAESRRIPLTAERTAHNGTLALAPQQFRSDLNFAQTEHVHGRFGHFRAQQLRLLLGFGLFLQQPDAGVRPAVQLVHIQTHPHALARVLVVERKRVNAEIADAQPAVAHGTGREHLHGVGQALHGFGNGVEKNALGQGAAGFFHHIAADDHARSRVAVKLQHLRNKIFMRPLADTHSVFLVCSFTGKERCRQRAPSAEKIRYPPSPPPSFDPRRNAARRLQRNAPPRAAQALRQSPHITQSRRGGPAARRGLSAREQAARQGVSPLQVQAEARQVMRSPGAPCGRQRAARPSSTDWGQT